MRLLKPVDAGYPKLLKQIPDPPVLFVKGDLDLNQAPTIAVVGTRQISPYGIEATQYFCRELAQLGFLVVSGFMYGVDAVAHQTMMQLNGPTVGVLGFGFNYMYPKAHVPLAEQMLKKGNTLISQFKPEVSPKPANFPARNRVVAGMSLGVLVVEAKAKSGSKITARLAAELGREVFAVPAPFNSPFSEGTKELINLGAKLVTNVSDILEEL